MNKSWLLTWTTYGTWLPGSERGFVGKVRDANGRPRLRNEYGTSVEPPNPALERYAREALLGPPVYLTAAQAACVGAQFHETAEYRGWTPHVMAVMWNHVHIALTAPAATSSVRGDS